MQKRNVVMTWLPRTLGRRLVGQRRAPDIKRRHDLVARLSTRAFPGKGKLKGSDGSDEVLASDSPTKTIYIHPHPRKCLQNTETFGLAGIDLHLSIAVSIPVY
jgi:hypothetical protein